mmetsp:Transcript_23954/g.53314  ORF Transcript_23954/g.53314 Transcript_23954/m.53314 type:complete len:216 (+) Transcript_23954:2696-3343(+)
MVVHHRGLESTAIAAIPKHKIHSLSTQFHLRTRWLKILCKEYAVSICLLWILFAFVLVFVIFLAIFLVAAAFIFVFALALLGRGFRFVTSIGIFVCRFGGGGGRVAAFFLAALRIRILEDLGAFEGSFQVASQDVHLKERVVKKLQEPVDGGHQERLDLLHLEVQKPHHQHVEENPSLHVFGLSHVVLDHRRFLAQKGGRQVLDHVVGSPRLLLC